MDHPDPPTRGSYMDSSKYTYHKEGEEEREGEEEWMTAPMEVDAATEMDDSTVAPTPRTLRGSGKKIGKSTSSNIRGR